MAIKKQNITISSRAGNERVEAAIPVFQRRYGMAKDQATAVAIRLESTGQLVGQGLIKPSGLVKGAAALAVAGYRRRSASKPKPKPLKTITTRSRPRKQGKKRNK